MLTLAVVLAASSVAAPQVPPNLRLPEPASAPSAIQRPVAEIERFRRDLEPLRSSGPEVERALQQIAQSYPDVEGLLLQRLPAAMPRELQALTVAARRFGTVKVADEILFQLLSRPVGEATRDLLEAMVALQGAASKPALRQCVRGRISGARRHATEILARLAGGDDLSFALELADDQQLDLQLSGVTLLGAIDEPRARQRLAELLARDPTVAGAACAALLRLDEVAVPVLREVLAQPAIDRAYPYAAFALAAGDRDGTRLPPATAIPALQQSLAGSDALARALAAVALATMSYHGAAGAVADRELAAALLDVVAPSAFVANFELLRRPAEVALQRLTGRSGDEAVGWRAWWQDTAATFAGMRARIDLQPGDAAAAVLTLRGERRPICLIGEQLADLPPVAGRSEYVLDAVTMQQLVARLEAAGFMRPGAIAVPSGLTPARSIELVVRGARTMVSAPAVPLPAFDDLVRQVTAVADAEFWQLLRHPVDEPERGAFWRAERRYRQSQTDPLVLARRSTQRAIRSWPMASPLQRQLILAWLLEQPDRRTLLTEADGAALAAIVRQAPAVGEEELLLLEIAANSPGDRVWRDCVDLAAGSRIAVGRVFKVLGADRVLQALGDDRPQVRRVAIDEVVEVRDLRAGDRLLAMFDDADPAVRRAAIWAAGQLVLTTARGPLIERIVAEGADPVLRRDALAALGRVGGEHAFPVLEQALASPVQADREAALRGLGELRDARAAATLARVFVTGHGTPTGEFARSYLQRLGAGLAVPALRSQLDLQNEAVRSEVVLLLGTWLDPQVVPDLIDLLQRRRDPVLVGSMVASATGLDVDKVEDAVSALRAWWRDHRQEPQWRWLLQALQRDKVPTSLDEAQFAAGAGLVAVPELARLLVECEAGRLRALAGAVLRTVTGEEYGVLLPSTPLEVRESIAARYRELFENARAAQGR